MPRKRAKIAEPKPFERQAAYSAAARAEGKHVKLTAELKTEADVANYHALTQRFPDLSNAALVKLALRELGAKRNKR